MSKVGGGGERKSTIFSSHHHKFHKAFHRTNPPSPHLMVLSLDYVLGYKKEEDEILFLRSSQPSYVHGVEYHCLRPQICHMLSQLENRSERFPFQHHTEKVKDLKARSLDLLHW